MKKNNFTAEAQRTKRSAEKANIHEEGMDDHAYPV
jgi:hypothetical protein